MVFDLDCGSGFMPKLKLSLAGFGLLSLLIGGYTIGSSYYAVSGYGDWSVPGQELVTLLCLLGIIMMLLSVFGLISRRTRCVSMAIFLGCGLLVTVGILSLKSADKIRMNGFERLTKEAAPLVTAIHEYHRENGVPPDSIDELLPKSAEEVAIKGGSLPQFKYFAGEIARERYHGNPWVLMLETPTGPLKWDLFLYYPLQNYPTLGHSGWLEKIKDWGYVHE